MQRMAAPLVLVATLCSARPPSAWACSGIAIGPMLVTPADGEVEVPIDVVPLVTYVSLGYPSDPSIELTTSSGDVVPVDLIVEKWAHDQLYRVLLTPQELLVPGQQYQIRYFGRSTAGVFTTGSSSDDDAPAAPVVRSVTRQPDMDYSSSCGDYTVIGIKIALEPVEGVTYVVREDGRFLAEQDVEVGCEPPCGGVVGDITCDGNRWTTDRRWELPPGAHTVQITARDRSGNESPPTEVSFEAECLPANPASEGGGCTAAGAPGFSGLAGLLALLWLRRQPRSGSGRYGWHGRTRGCQVSDVQGAARGHAGPRGVPGMPGSLRCGPFSAARGGTVSHDRWMGDHRRSSPARGHRR